MTKNSSFLCFVAVFMSYCPKFRNSRAIYNGCKTQYMFEDMTKNSSFSCVMAGFMSYCPQFWSFKAIYKLASYAQKLIILRIMAIFIRYFPQFWVSRGIRMTLRHDT